MVKLHLHLVIFDGDTPCQLCNYYRGRGGSYLLTNSYLSFPWNDISTAFPAMRTLSRPTTRLVPRLHLSQSLCFWVMGMRPHVPRLPCLACFMYLCTSAAPTSFKLLLLFTDQPKIASYRPATWVLFPTCLLSFKMKFTPLCVLAPEDAGKQSNTPTKYNLYCQWY